jgi:hypothetical protein
VAAGCGSPNPEAGDTTESLPPRVTTSSVPTPPRPVPPAPSEVAPMRLLLAGDGLMWDAGPAMRAAAEATGPSIVRDESYWGFALSRPGWRDWRSLWPAYVAEFQPTVVAVTFGIHDTEPQVVDGRVVDPDSPDWPDWYASQVRRAMDALTAGDASVYWLGMPPVADPASNARIRRLNQVTRKAVEVNPYGHFLDVPALVSSTGDAAVVDPFGSPYRKLDRLHLCQAGAAQLADTLVTALGAAWGTVTDPSWITGPWRADRRYDWTGPPGCSAAS